MSKKELAELQKDYEYLMSQEGGFKVICQNYDIHKEYLDKLELQAFDKINESLKKEFEWIKWIVAIAAGVFSVMTTQLAKGNFQGEQLLLIKFAIISNAIGVIFGAVFLYQDVKTEMGFVKGIEIQRKTVMLTGKPRYDKAIPSDRNFIMRVAKFCCMTSLSIAMCIWIWFIWNL